MEKIIKLQLLMKQKNDDYKWHNLDDVGYIYLNMLHKQNLIKIYVALFLWIK